MLLDNTKFPRRIIVFMDSSDSSDDNGDTNNLICIYYGVPMFDFRQRYAFLRLKRVLS